MQLTKFTARDYGRVMEGSLRCSRRRRWVRVLRSSPVLERAKACTLSDQSSLKLVAWAEIQTWRMGVLGVMTNFEEPFSKMMFMTPLLSSNSKPALSSSAAMRDCLRVSRARSDSRRKVASSIMGLVYPVYSSLPCVLFVGCLGNGLGWDCAVSKKMACGYCGDA